MIGSEQIWILVILVARADWEFCRNESLGGAESSSRGLNGCNLRDHSVISLGNADVEELPVVGAVQVDPEATVLQAADATTKVLGRIFLAGGRRHLENGCKRKISWRTA